MAALDAVEHHSRGRPRSSQAICSALSVSAESGDVDMAQPIGLRANRSSTTARYRASKDQQRSKKPLGSADKGEPYTGSDYKEYQNSSSDMWVVPQHVLNDEL